MTSQLSSSTQSNHKSGLKSRNGSILLPSRHLWVAPRRASMPCTMPVSMGMQNWLRCWSKTGLTHLRRTGKESIWCMWERRGTKPTVWLTSRRKASVSTQETLRGVHHCIGPAMQHQTLRHTTCSLGVVRWTCRITSRTHLCTSLWNRLSISQVRELSRSYWSRVPIGTWRRRMGTDHLTWLRKSQMKKLPLRMSLEACLRTLRCIFLVATSSSQCKGLSHRIKPWWSSVYSCLDPSSQIWSSSFHVSQWFLGLISVIYRHLRWWLVPDIVHALPWNFHLLHTHSQERTRLHEG